MSQLNVAKVPRKLPRTYFSYVATATVGLLAQGSIENRRPAFFRTSPKRTEAKWLFILERGGEIFHFHGCGAGGRGSAAFPEEYYNRQ